MAEPTSDELRARYRELWHIVSGKFKTNEDSDLANEIAEVEAICNILTDRGYVMNSDASDWVLDLSPRSWLGEDENR